MNRRTLLQILTAFFASLFGSFRRLPELGAAALHKLPFGPRGKISPEAAWFSPSTYEATTSVSAETMVEMTAAVQKGAELPISPFWYTYGHQKSLDELRARQATTTPFRLPVTSSSYELEPQEGHVVMILKNPAIRGREYHPERRTSYEVPDPFPSDPEAVSRIETNHGELLKNFGQV